MQGIIDFHTHAFPDSLAERAIKALEAEADGVKAFHDGRVSSLLRSMDEAGIQKSVVCSIATKPAQFEPILKWSLEIKSDRIIPFPSFHPDDDKFKDHAARIGGEGFRGVKFHPFYQDFYLDDDRLLFIYEELLKHGLIVVMHTGYDIAFERIRRADPKRILNVYKRFPELKLVTTHLGAWEQWDEVRDMLIGKNIYMELSFSIEYLKDKLREFILSHPLDYILFGTDSPWTSQKATIEAVRALKLGDEIERRLFKDNAARLLNI